MPRSVCSFGGCERIADIPTMGLCGAHYCQQWRGEELRPLRTQWTPESKLLSKRVIDEHGCWLWVGAKDTAGYGHFKVAGKMHRAHRLAYELWVGPLDGDTIHHMCTVRNCFNPAHLEPATLRENSLEMHERLALRRKIKVLEARVAALEAA